MKMKIPLLPYFIQISHLKGNKNADGLAGKIKAEVSRDYDKIFCIGLAKTGTTSIAKLLSQFGFTLGNQPVAEILAEDWSVQKRSDRIINYCHTADAFQDVPFNYPGFYRELDKAFPGSKFILTVRNSPEQWYNSLVRFHTKLFSSDKSRPPDEEDKRNAVYRYKGYILQSARYVWNYPEVPMYDEKAYKHRYLDHNAGAREYFRGRPDDFIEINLARKEDFHRLCRFLNVTTNLTDFPWENKT